MKKAPPRSRRETERACLARLTEMGEALERMQRELPDDMLPLGDEARRTVQVWLTRLSAGGANLEEMSEAMREINSLMDTLTARLLLVPWDGHPVSRRNKPS